MLQERHAEMEDHNNMNTYIEWYIVSCVSKNYH